MVALIVVSLRHGGHLNAPIAVMSLEHGRLQYCSNRTIRTIRTAAAVVVVYEPRVSMRDPGLGGMAED